MLLLSLLALAMSLVMALPPATTVIPLIPHRVQRARRLQPKAHQPRPTRYNRRRTESFQVAELFQGYGTHYVDLWCGSPTPQRQTVIVDTGSAVTAFPCSGCRDQCGKDYHIDQVYEEGFSTSFEKLPCDSCMRGRCTVVNGNTDDCKIGMSYQEGSSWTAFEASDYCYIGGPHGRPLAVAGKDGVTADEPAGDVDKDGESTADVDPSLAAGHAFRLVFGCQTKLTGLFKTQVRKAFGVQWKYSIIYFIPDRG